MKRRITTTLIALGLLLGGALWSLERREKAKAAPLTTITVTNTSDGGLGSLRQAILDAMPGDTINFNLSGCPCAIELTLGKLLINKDLTIQGPGANLLTVSGNSTNFRVFEIALGFTVTLDGLTIRGGRIALNGGGILNFGTLTVSHSTVSNNSATFGGGIYNAGTLMVSDSTVSNNSVGSDGGGINNSLTLIVSNSTVSNNSASSRGGGIFNGASTMTVSNSTITGNRANSNGDRHHQPGFRLGLPGRHHDRDGDGDRRRGQLQSVQLHRHGALQLHRLLPAGGQPARRQRGERRTSHPGQVLLERE